MLNDDHGIGALGKCVHWLEDTVGVDILWLGRRALDRRNSFTAELCGAHLFYTIKLDGSWVFLSAQPLDSTDPPESLVTMADNAGTWTQICRLVAALERHQIKSLQPKPLEVGEGRDGFVIG